MKRVSLAACGLLLASTLALQAQPAFVGSWCGGPEDPFVTTITETETDNEFHVCYFDPAGTVEVSPNRWIAQAECPYEGQPVDPLRIEFRVEGDRLTQIFHDDEDESGSQEVNLQRCP